MINSFKDYLVEESKVVYFTFGRMNPPTIGHEKLLDVLSRKSGKNPYFVFLSQSTGKKDPLQYTHKIKHARKMFPKHARQILINKKVKTVFDAVTYLYNQGYKKVVMVVGSDRVREFEILLDKYNSMKGRHGFYNFESITVESAGERDPDSSGVEGMSASKQRENASNNDFTKFSQGVPKQMPNKDARRLFNDVRKGLGLKEETEFKNHVSLKPVSEAREKYVKGDLFELGDKVVIKKTDQLGEVTWLGSNYVTVKIDEEVSVKKWLTDVEKIDEYVYDAEFIPSPTGKRRFATIKVEKEEEPKKKVAQDADIKDRKGTQPAKYHRGLSKSTKKARDAQFKRQTKMSDSNPKAYKPAPGDATAKTKPSKYTKAFKSMYGEENDAIKQVKDAIKKEKDADKVKHDRMLDRARLKDTRRTNKATNVKV
jgi:hypothetical protein